MVFQATNRLRYQAQWVNVCIYVWIPATYLPPTTVTDISMNETTTHIFDTYTFFVHPHWYNFPVVSDNWHYAIGVFISIVGIIGILGNATVIYIFSTYVWFLWIEVYQSFVEF